MLSIIIPTINEAQGIATSLARLAPLRLRGAEVIVVDGGSDDGTAALAQPHADVVITTHRGRATQMNAGAAMARGDVLVFLHVDTQLPVDADELITNGLANKGKQWGRFDVYVVGQHPMLAVIAMMMNWRSRITGIATGDQTMFVRRQAFEAVGGFPGIPLMEDIALSRRLKQRGAPLCLSARVLTSGRRWETYGVWRTILLMWWLRLAYYCGVDPATLARHYRSVRPE